MIIQVASEPTLTLLRRIRESHDDGQPPLFVGYDYLGSLIVTRQDGTEPSPTESAHVRGWIAAHNVQPL